MEQAKPPRHLGTSPLLCLGTNRRAAEPGDFKRAEAVESQRSHESRRIGVQSPTPGAVVARAVEMSLARDSLGVVLEDDFLRERQVSGFRSEVSGLDECGTMQAVDSGNGEGMAYIRCRRT